MPIYKILVSFLTWQAKKMKPHKIAGLMRLQFNKEAPDASD